MRKSIFIFNQFAISPDMSGGTRHYDFASELIKKDYNVYIFASDFSLQELEFKKLNNQLYKREIIDNINFIWVKTVKYKKNNYKRILNQIIFAINAYKVALKFDKPDIIIGSSPQLITAFIALLLSIKYKIKLISEIRDLWPESLITLNPKLKFHPYTIFLSILEKIIYKKSKHIIVFTPGNKEKLNNRGYAKVSVIPNGINTNSKINENKVNEYAKFFNKEKFNLVYTGSIGIANNLQIILKIANKVENVEFLIVGNGPLKNEMEEKIKEKGIYNVKFINPIPKKHIYEFLYNADACFITLKNVKLFKYGVSPNKLFDYMYAKKPIICSVGGWSNELIEKSNCGIAIQSENEKEFIYAVNKLKSMKNEELKQMGENGYKYVIKHFSRNNMINKFIKILEE